MNTRDLASVLRGLLSELIDGSPDQDAGTYMLNRGDAGLSRSLDRLSAPAASATTNGGASIAAHVDHLRYGFALLNRWASGEPNPWRDADWTTSWRKSSVSEQSWRALRNDLRREADAWRDALGKPRELDDTELGWIIGSISHLAYHMGAIRQIDRATRGPTAEDEQRLKAKASASKST